MAQASGKTENGSRRNAQRTQGRILEAARTAFCTHGVDGATMEDIARRAKVNKRMLYHYFGSKADLYLTVLENAYEARRHYDSVLDLRQSDPEEGMRRLIRASFAYSRENPEYVKLLIVENLNGARHLKRSQKILKLHTPLLEEIGDLLERGGRIGLFRAYVDPVQVFMTIASLCFFYYSNTATVSTILGRDLMAPAAFLEREAHIEEVVLGYLRPRTEQERQPGIPA